MKSSVYIDESFINFIKKADSALCEAKNKVKTESSLRFIPFNETHLKKAPRCFLVDTALIMLQKRGIEFLMARDFLAQQERDIRVVFT